MTLNAPLGLTVGLGQSLNGTQTPQDTLDAQPVVQPPEEVQTALPTFSDNPLGAIGLVLSETSRGLRGQPSQVPELMAQDEQAKQNQIRRSLMVQEVLDKFVTNLDSTADPEQRQALIAEYQANFGETLGMNFSEAAAKDPVELRTALDATGQLNPELYANMAPARMFELLNDPRTLDAYQELSDANSLPQALSAIERAMNLAETDPEAAAALDQIRQNGITMSEIEQIAPQIGMQAWEVSALRANQDEIFPQLSEQYGIQFRSTRRMQLEEAAQIQARYRGGGGGGSASRPSPTVADLFGGASSGGSGGASSGVGPDDLTSLGESTSSVLPSTPSGRTDIPYANVPLEDLSETELDVVAGVLAGQSPLDAMLRATGAVRTVLDQTSGVMIRVDEINGTSEVVPLNLPGGVQGQLPPDVALVIDPETDPETLSSTLGGLGVLTEVTNWAFDVFNAGSPFPESQRLEVALNALNQQEKLDGVGLFPGRATDNQRELIEEGQIQPGSLSVGTAAATARVHQRLTFWRNAMDAMQRQISNTYNVNDLQKLINDRDRALPILRSYEALDSIFQASLMPDTPWPRPSVDLSGGTDPSAAQPQAQQPQESQPARPVDQPQVPPPSGNTGPATLPGDEMSAEERQAANAEELAAGRQIQEFLRSLPTERITELAEFRRVPAVTVLPLTRQYDALRLYFNDMQQEEREAFLALSDEQQRQFLERKLGGG